MSTVHPPLAPASAGKMPRPGIGARRRGRIQWTPYLLLLPSAAFLLVFFAYPMVEAFVLAVHSEGGWTLSHFQTMVRDAAFSTKIGAYTKPFKVQGTWVILKADQLAPGFAFSEELGVLFLKVGRIGQHRAA